MDERIELVEEHREEHGLNRCLKALGVSKGTWHYRKRGGSKAAEKKARDQELKEPTIEIMRKHPAYGYRRIKPDLEEAIGETVNHKRLRRLLGEWELALHRTVARPEPSPVRRILSEARGHLNLVRDRNPRALEILSTDFTELRYGGGDRKAWLIGLIDLKSSWVPGWAVGALGQPRTGSESLETYPTGLQRAGRGDRRNDRTSGSGFGLHQLRLAAGPPARRRRSGLVLGERSQGQSLDRVLLGPLQAGEPVAAS